MKQVLVYGFIAFTLLVAFGFIFTLHATEVPSDLAYLSKESYVTKFNDGAVTCYILHSWDKGDRGEISCVFKGVGHF